MERRADTLNGDASSLFSNARGGNDFIFGGNSKDTLQGDAIQLNENAQGGNDVLSGGAGDDFIFGDSTFMLDNTSGGNDLLTGGEGNDALFGDSSPAKSRNGGNDTLIGVNPFRCRPGVGEVDNLTGNGGRDRFVLGDGRTAYYVGQGEVDHGIINDFSVADQDVIQLHGKAVDYDLKNFSLGSISGVDIFLDGSNELIGSVLNVSTTTLNLYNSAFRLCRVIVLYHNPLQFSESSHVSKGALRPTLLQIITVPDRFGNGSGSLLSLP